MNIVENIKKLLKHSLHINTLNNIKAGEVIHIVTQEDQHSSFLSLEQFASNPYRKRGRLSLYTPSSFVRYFREHAMSHSRVYVDVENRKISAVFDPHEPVATFATINTEEKKVPKMKASASSKPEPVVTVRGSLQVINHNSGSAGWHLHRAGLNLRYSRAFKIFYDAKSRYMSQVAFAEFIEDNAKFIVRPESADLIEMALAFKAKKSVEFQKAVNVQNGDIALEFTETTQASGGRSGKLEVPEYFTIATPIFEGGEPVEIEARFNYRIDEGKLTMAFSLPAIEIVIDNAFNAIVTGIVSDIGSDSVLEAQEPATIDYSK